MNEHVLLASKLALAVAYQHTSAPTSLCAARAILEGRLNLFSADSPALLRAQEIVAKRPYALEDRREVRKTFEHLLSEQCDFKYLEIVERAPSVFRREYTLVPGRPLEERIEAWLAQLPPPVRTTRASCRYRDNDKDEGTSYIDYEAAGPTSYRIPLESLPNPSKAPELNTRAIEPRCSIPMERIVALAEKIDDSGADSLEYSTILTQQFLPQLRTSTSKNSLELESGQLQVLVAPTGTGKSVFMRLLAIQLASERIPVCIVVPDVSSVWSEVHKLRSAISSARLEVDVSGLCSTENLREKIRDHMAHAPSWDEFGDELFREHGYTCELRAYETTPEGAGVDDAEPCTRLRIINQGSKKERVKKTWCPFQPRCEKFGMLRRAVTSQIIVVNHHAFVSGRARERFLIDGHETSAESILTLVYRRSAVTLIDEIDQLQKTVAESTGRGLALSGGSGNSPFLELQLELDRLSRDNQFPREIEVHEICGHLSNIHQLELLIAEKISKGIIEWPFNESFAYVQQNDPQIYRCLFSRNAKKEQTLRKILSSSSDVFQRNSDCDESRELRSLYRKFGMLNPDDSFDQRVVRLRSVVEKILSASQNYSRGSITKLTNRLSNALIIRALLERLQDAIASLRPRLPQLAQEGSHRARQLHDALLGFMPWQPSPRGALGRTLVGFRFRPGEKALGELEVQQICGDPQGFMSQLPAALSLRACGTRRIVLGLSATCFFPGSPTRDVPGTIVAHVPDRGIGKIRITQAVTNTRVSGARGSKGQRQLAVKNAASELYRSTLRQYLDACLETPGRQHRARALIAVSSYAQCESAFLGISGVASSNVRIRYLLREGEEPRSPDSAISRRQIESFGALTGPAILIAPLSVVARGHNILVPGTEESAIGGVFVLSRHVPDIGDPANVLRLLSYESVQNRQKLYGDLAAAARVERKKCHALFSKIQKSPRTLRGMNPGLRLALVCDSLVDLIQLAGRARRGKTDVDIVFVDAAYQDEYVPWKKLVREVLKNWERRGTLDIVRSLYGDFFVQLACYSGFRAKC